MSKSKRSGKRAPVPQAAPLESALQRFSPLLSARGFMAFNASSMTSFMLYFPIITSSLFSDILRKSKKLFTSRPSRSTFLRQVERKSFWSSLTGPAEPSCRSDIPSLMAARGVRIS